MTDLQRGTEVPRSGPQTASSQEPSYFEIPTKDAPSAGRVSGDDPPREQGAGASSSAEPAHGHASFTIEFDTSGAAGKASSKDRAAKVGPETKPRPKRPVGEELSPLQTAMVAAEVKVADWLAQNELPLALKDIVAEEDGESVKSDVPVHLRSLKGATCKKKKLSRTYFKASLSLLDPPLFPLPGSKHEDGTQSDSENALAEQRRTAAVEERPWGLWGGPGMKFREGRANVPEGLFAEEESPARRRKSSTSKSGGGLVERRRDLASRQQGGREERYHHQHHGDDYSDRGTYTIELENGDQEEEEEEARKMIDKVEEADRFCPE